MATNYVNVGGWLYQPGSAAYKRALELYNAMPKPATTTTVPSPSTPSTPAAAPNFPTYPTKTTTGTVSSGGTSGAGGASLAPAPATTGKGAYGLVPQVPNPIDTAGGAIAGNAANLPSLATLGTDTTKVAAGLAALPFQENLPGYEGMLGQSSQNILANLKGVIDPSTWQQLQQLMAERGARLGISPASPNFNTALMRALNESITAKQAMGQQQLNAAVARTPTGQPFNVAGYQVAPADLQAAQYASNVYGAAPDPTMAAQANLDSLLKAIEAGRASGLGGLGGGGGGGPMIPRMTSPGGGIRYVGMPYYGGVGSSGGGVSYGPTAPGTVPEPASGYYYQNPYETLAPPGTIGESVFDPYSLGGYTLGGGLDTGGVSNPYDLGGYNYGNVSPDVAELAAPLMDPSMFGVYDPMAGY